MKARITQESLLASHGLPVGYHATGAHRCCLRAGQDEDQGASRPGEQCRCWHGRVHRLDHGGVDASGDGRELLRTRGDDQTIPSAAGRQTRFTRGEYLLRGWISHQARHVVVFGIEIRPGIVLGLPSSRDGRVESTRQYHRARLHANGHRRRARGIAEHALERSDQ